MFERQSPAVVALSHGFAENFPEDVTETPRGISAKTTGWIVREVFPLELELEIAPGLEPSTVTGSGGVGDVRNGGDETD